MKNIIFPVCADLLKIEDDTVCRGILNEFVPWFLDIFATGMNLDSGIVCGNLGIQNSFIFFTFFNLKTNFIIKKKGYCDKIPIPFIWNPVFPKPKPPYVPPHVFEQKTAQ